MNYASHREQILIYLGKFRREFYHTKGWNSFFSAFLIILVTCFVSGENGFGGFNISQTSFIIICACIWIGLFNSITLICKERDIIKHEYRSGMKLSAYITAHMLFQALVSFIEALIVTITIKFFYSSSIESFAVVAYFLTIFLTIYAADALGILLSSLVKNVKQAMMVMPFMLLLQFLFSGQIGLDGGLASLTNLMISRFGLDGFLALSGGQNKLGGWLGGEPYPVVFCWLVLIVFIAGYTYLSIKQLKSVEKDTRG